MKAYVMVVNSLLLMMMAALTLFQTGCTPITPSLDRRLFVPKKDTNQPGSTSENSLNSKKDESKEPIYREASLHFDHDSFLNEFDDLELFDDSENCKISELDFDTVELFRKDGKLEIELERPLDTEFSFEVALSKSDSKILAHKEINVKLSPSGAPHVWVFELADNQDQKLLQKVETNIKSIQWSVCPAAFRAKVKLHNKEKLVKDSADDDKDKDSIARKVGTKAITVL